MSRFKHAYPDKTDKKYLPSFFDGEYISDFHRDVKAIMDPYRGKLLNTDHLKLYEAGYYARGDILEIGRYCAKSTILLGLGLRDRGRLPLAARITSIDLSARQVPAAMRNLATFGLLDRVNIVQGPSAQVIDVIHGTWDTAFIDGDHSYDGVTADVLALRGRIRPGGVVLFHDFWDGRNADPDRTAFGVRQAVEDHAAEVGIEFRGGFGALAVFEQT